jgi:alanyl-tRNA synthetase
MRTSADVREGFRAFFESKGHLRHPSGSLVPANYDPSVLLTTAGMQPLKPFFLGLAQPPNPTLTTVQKCFRTTDIDEVGTTARHLTFFEMLGNFSFGDYFKEGAIAHAWEFVTEHLQLDQDLLWATVFAGDPELSIGPDEVAIKRWQEVGVRPERIVRLPRSDNFWQAGPTGPCGPCSELYYDRGLAQGCGRDDCAPGCECDRFLEFWNLVFMEFELHADNSLTPLPKQNIDTGMGVERCAAILQGVHSVYETDGFQAIMQWVERETGTSYGADEVSTKAHRVLADHGRAMTFLVADGVTPGNEGRGYVLRRVIRRAVLQGNRIGLEAPFLARLADVVIDQMGSVYPELEQNRKDVHAVLTAEEERFSATLARGLKLFEERATGDVVTGDDAFLLHDTYGFPVELTTELARERGMGVDIDRFHILMGEQRDRSRSSAGEKGDQRAAEFARAAGFRSSFVGYEKTEVLTQVGAVEEIGDGLFLAKLRESPFYVESGGQVTDAGWIETEDGRRAELRQAFRFEDDQALLLEGSGFAAGDRVKAVVPWATRFPTAANHTATHLLHEALRQVLGEHVRQAGSAVRADKLRFDFTHGAALTHEERARVEEIVNRAVFENLPVRIYETPIAEARQLGAQMLFGEKYGDIVRVVDVDGFSRELCGGTHVRATAEVGPFAILSESSVGSGARRIEAVTAGEAYALLRARSQELDELRGEIAELRKELKKRPAAGAAQAGPGGSAGADEAVAALIAGATVAGGVSVVAADVGELEGDALLDLSDRIKSKAQPAAVVLGAAHEGRVTIVVNLDGSLPGRGIDAGAIVKIAAALVGGGGGGRPTMARAGGKDPSKVGEAVQAARQAILALLG